MNKKLSRFNNRNQVTNDKDKAKILIIGILIIVAVLILGFALGQYGNHVEAQILGKA